MEEYADIYYVDARNATTDHRRPAGSSPRPGFPVAQPTRAVVVPPGARPVVYPAQPITAWQPPVAYASPSPLSNLFQRLGTGDVIEMIAQVFAVLQPLPAAPTATEKMQDNLENLILYQGALAQHAKRDEQLRTIGHIVGKLV
jgi:hypothetical protein